MCVSVAGYVMRLTQLTAYGTCTDVRNDLGCHSGGISFAECTVTWNLWGACFTLWLVGAFIGSSFWDKILGTRHAGALRISLCGLLYWGVAVSVRCSGWAAASRATLPGCSRVLMCRAVPLATFESAFGHKERGGPHTQRPTPHVPGTVIGAASHRYPEFHGRCRRDEESSTTLWCLLARFSRLFPPALSGSGVRLKDREGRGESLFFLEFFKISRA